MSHCLDRPVWTALSSAHATLAEGNRHARRYPAAIVPFAATASDDAGSLQALADLVPDGDSVVLAQADAVAIPPGLSELSRAAAVQMVAETTFPRVEDIRVRQLTLADAPEMLALATATNPGPFTLKALSLGDFWGVRIDGRLAAMAGQRMRQPGYIELSGVCSHADFRGRGLARLLSLFVAGEICAGGDTPYLHAYAGNAVAIRLYESIGFALRCRMHVVKLGRAG
ncbi:GNAT family N-acetyltransferase [Labrys neptuniae]|uniref:GNAT family N-acetyltransferase n=1 Tax=Labrys TaxID=204476 RepID=UPI00288D58D5|nr:GNAT family N-acetyltransferase [Labrys neptuniae]MDT3375714.1 GNAT family N-acetyltransferase [Labrys neptuniae]